jgi:hypothetical protein
MNTFTTRIFTLMLLFISLSVTAQNEIKFYNDQKIKKENNLYGVMMDKKWVVPAKYDKIEGFGGLTKINDKVYTTNGGYLVCYRGQVMDLYDAGYPNKLVVSDLNPAQFELFKRYSGRKNIVLVAGEKWANAVDEFTEKEKIINSNFRGGTAFVKNGKWGFATQYFYVAPQFDSLFTICQEDAAGVINNSECDEVVGVLSNGVRGVVDAQGKVIVLNNDYTSFRYRFTGESFQVLCLHKSGIEVPYDRYAETKNIYIETKNNAGLIGYVYKGDFIEPKYKEVKKCYLPVADFECILPDGTVEYRKGTAIVKPNEIADAKTKSEKEQQQYEEQKKIQQQKQAEEAALKAKQAEKLRLLAETKKDSLRTELLNLYFKRNKVLYEKVFALNEYLKSTVQVQGGEINRSQWFSRSREIKNNYCKNANDELISYNNELKHFEFTAGKVDVYDEIVSYHSTVKSFIIACENWADYISTMGGEAEDVIREMEALEKPQMAMAKKYDQLKALLNSYLEKK